MAYPFEKKGKLKKGERRVGIQAPRQKRDLFVAKPVKPKGSEPDAKD